MSRERTPKPARGVPSLDGLVAALAASPNLPGAACRGQGRLFDSRLDDDAGGETETPAARRDRHGRALKLCAACPTLDACREWASPYPPAHLHGVVAGRVISPNPRKATP